VLTAIACRSLRPIRIDPVPAEASRLLEEAEALDALGSTDAGDSAARGKAAELARQALAAAPDWVAPERLQDDLLRADLRGVEALASHRDRIAREGESARELYLAGRLEGADGEARFDRAAELDPDLAWARHGLAVSAERRGDARAAIGHARAAYARSRDPFERTFFAASLARILAADGQREEALETLAERLAASDLTPRDRLVLSAQSVGLELDSRDSARSRSAWRGGLDLLRDAELPDDDVENLARKLRRFVGGDEGGFLEISSALSARRSPVRDRLRAELMLAAGPTPLALGLLERSLAAEGRLEASGPLLRAARFAAGDFAPAVEQWLADLPSQVIGPDGLPRDERLALVVRRARAVALRLPGDDPRESWFGFGDALIQAGWFKEARALAGTLARSDFERALALEARAAQGLALLDSLGDLIQGTRSSPGERLAAASADRAADPGREEASTAGAVDDGEERSLAGLLAAMGPIFARSGFLAGDSLESGSPAADRDAAGLSRELAASPRLDYGIAGEVVHPGPTFTKADDAVGLGKEGDPVPGLARELRAINRFGLLGELSGAGGPDGTVLSLVLTEDRRGEHLGVRWSGSIAWCEGVDVQSRAERGGARISAAALHEGYWIDIDSVRGERSLFAALRARFSGEGAPARVSEALAVKGFRVEASGEPERDRRERTRAGSALGESSRVRLAILRDRGARNGDPEGSLGEVGLDEFAQVTAIHEEGHLTDRTRFLPISEHWGAVLRFLVECGFSPAKVAERLEYRAQLVALVDAPDPRLPLAQVLDAAEAAGRGLTAHAAGYGKLLEDLLLRLDDELAKDPRRFPGIDRGRTLVHQLHVLAPGEVAELARGLAKEKRLVRR